MLSVLPMVAQLIRGRSGPAWDRRRPGPLAGWGEVGVREVAVRP